MAQAPKERAGDYIARNKCNKMEGMEENATLKWSDLAEMIRPSWGLQTPEKSRQVPDPETH